MPLEGNTTPSRHQLALVAGSPPIETRRSEIDGHETAIHRTDYQLNERVIPLGTRLMARAVLELMG